MFLEWKTYFESKTLKWVRFWINFFTTSQKLKQNKYFVSNSEMNSHKASELESRFLQPIRFRWKKLFLKKKNKICWRTRSRKTIYPANLHRKIVKVSIFVNSWNVVPEIVIRKVFWFKTFKKNQISSQILYNASDCE